MDLEIKTDFSGVLHVHFSTLFLEGLIWLPYFLVPPGLETEVLTLTILPYWGKMSFRSHELHWNDRGTGCPANVTCGFVKMEMYLNNAEGECHIQSNAEIRMMVQQSKENRGLPAWDPGQEETRLLPESPQGESSQQNVPSGLLASRNMRQQVLPVSATQCGDTMQPPPKWIYNSWPGCMEEIIMIIFKEMVIGISSFSYTKLSSWLWLFNLITHVEII